MAETVDSILAGLAERDPNREPTALELALAELDRIDRLIKRLTQAARPETDSIGYDDWRKIYDVLFSDRNPGIPGLSLRSQVRATLETVGIPFPDYYDPDRGYDDDSWAWIRAFEEIRNEVEKRLRAERGE